MMRKGIQQVVVRRILLVEDEIEIRRLFCFILERAGFTVIQVGDVENALEILRDKDYDAVLTDFELPGQTGDTLVQSIHRDVPGMPAILMSTHYQLADIAKACGADAYFHKLQPPLELVELLHTIMNRGVPRR